MISHMAVSAMQTHLVSRAAEAPPELRDFWLTRAALYRDVTNMSDADQARVWHGLPRLAPMTEKERGNPLAHLPTITLERAPGGVVRFDLCGETCWRDDPAELARRAEGAREIHLEIDTPGGSGWFAFEFCARLKATGAKIIATARKAYSSGAIILQAGEVRRIRRDGGVMIHGPQTAIVGGAEDFEAAAGKLRKEREMDVALFTAATKQTRETVEAWLSRDTYLTPDEAVSLNLADVVVD